MLINIKNNVNIKIKKLHPDAILPQYKTRGAAAMDLYAIEDVAMYTNKAIDNIYNNVKIIRTGLSIALPDGYEAQIRARSGLASKGIIVTNSPGTIDSDYRGEICVLLCNISNVPFDIKKGDRIAQMLISPVYYASWQEVNELDETERGNGGFGSTGINDQT